MQIHEITSGNDFIIDLKRTSGEEQMVCPKCSHLRKKKSIKCFSWNNDKNVGRCSHCESSFVIKSETRMPIKTYIVPQLNNRTALSQEVIDYFFKRGISQTTLLDFKITEGSEYMPQTGKNENTIQFNYFRGGALVNTKFRDGRKNFKLVKGAELILYNLDAIKESTQMVICEGEPDAMSWHQAGYKFVVSVPNGASKNQKLEWIDNCYEYFENKARIYLSTDNDDVGLQLRDELARRLGYERCFKVDLGNHKDANEHLVIEGEESLLRALKTAKEFPIQGVFGINDVWDDILHIYEHGLPTGAKSGDRQFDEHLGCMPGELTMVTGVPGHGKSIYLDQISIGLSINSGWKFGVCSPESHPMAFYFTRLIKRLLGKKFSKNNISAGELQRSREWVEDKFNLIKPEDGYSLDSILESARVLVVRKGINGLILDPWNRIENTKPSSMNDGEWIVSCLAKIIAFAQKTGVHVFLVAHPTKMQKDAKGENYLVPNLYSISGSAHFFNMTQNGFTIFRNMVTQMTEVHFQKVKWEHLGKTGLAEYTYNEDNARFYAGGDDPNVNWLTGNEETSNYHQASFISAITISSETSTDNPF
jgi:twinkle protein